LITHGNGKSRFLADLKGGQKMHSTILCSWTKKSGCVVAVFSALIIGGCATEAAKKPEGSTRESGSAATASPRPGAGKSEVSSRQAASGSSLDALREGKSPASGPLKEIYFDFDRYDLSSEARAILKGNADWLRANPSVNLELEGHCDERGTTEYNLALGAKRARSAMDYLVSLGVAPARMKTVSYGEEIPVCREKSEDCYQKNRRDRFVDIRARPGT
jgi:peptidoglycan-associated lipoprotein